VPALRFAIRIVGPVPRRGDDAAAISRSTVGVSIIEHLCAEPRHQLPEDVAEPVITYLGKCGYCPAGAAEGHDWRATGGKTLGTVREWLNRPPLQEPAVAERR
jgi:hypothetical protein